MNFTKAAFPAAHSGYVKAGLGKAALKSVSAAVAIGVLGAIYAPANALQVIPCQSDPLNSHKVCGVRGAVYDGKTYDIDLYSGLAENLYGFTGENLTVTSQALAEGLMAASAEALNAFALTQPFNPNKPPILFGDAGEIDFKIAWELDVITIPGERFWNSSRSRWEQKPDRWEIVPVAVPWPADVPNVWADVTEVPGPLPILGAAAAFGYSRKLRKRIKSTEPEVISTTAV
jgi:hypothetical protein